jgi:hypothetical protein
MRQRDARTVSTEVRQRRNVVKDLVQFESGKWVCPPSDASPRHIDRCLYEFSADHALTRYVVENGAKPGFKMCCSG